MFDWLKNLQKEKGFSLIDVIIAMGLAAMVFSAIGSAIFYSSRLQQKDNRTVSVMAARNFVYRALTQWTSLRATLVGNSPIFDCAINNTGCTAGVNTSNFILYTRNSAGTLQALYNASASPKQGFDENGTVCTPAGGLNAPTIDCPVRVDFEWEPLCTTGCTDPVPIAITAKFTTFDPANPTVPAQSGFNFRLLKSAHSRTCKTPWGTTVNDGATFTAYNNTTGICDSISRSCNDTMLDENYSYIYESCQCELPWGGTIAIGASVTAWAAATGNPCTSQLRTCQANGILSNSGNFQSCVAAAPCTLPWGGSISHGSSVEAWLTSSGTCTSQTRTCNNGVLSGSYTFQTCTNAPCTAPWGAAVAHGASVVAYRYIMESPTCAFENRVCNNGNLSGTYTNQTCTACSGATHPLCTSPSGCTSYCWYVGATGDNCTNRCVGEGGCVIGGIRDYTGSAGSATNCATILTLLGEAGSSVTNISSQTYGCMYQVSNVLFRPAGRYRGTGATTCGASAASTKRVCSCAN